MLKNITFYHYAINVGASEGYSILLDYKKNHLVNEHRVPFLSFFVIGSSPMGKWGNGQQASSISERNPLPYGINVRWFSVTENQFWEGYYTFDQSKLAKLSQYRVNNLAQQSTVPFMQFFVITVYIALEGLVTIWIGGAGEQYLLAQFKAGKVGEANWDNFIRPILLLDNNEAITREQFIQEQLEGTSQYVTMTEQVKQQIKKHQLPPVNTWKNLMNTYPWVLTTNDEYKLDNYFTWYNNGEQYYTYNDQDQYALPLRALPYRLITYLTDTKNKVPLVLDLELNQQEVINAVEKLNKMVDTLDVIVMHLNIDNELTNVDIYLMKGGKNILLQEVRGELIGS